MGRAEFYGDRISKIAQHLVNGSQFCLRMHPILNNSRVSLIELMSQQLGRNSSNFDDVMHFVTLLKSGVILRTGIVFTNTTRYKMAVALQHGGRLVTIDINTTRNL